MPTELGWMELQFPFGGLSENNAIHRQDERTSIDLKNVRGYDPSSGRLRGAQRPGSTKFLSSQHTNAPGQDIGYIKTATGVSSTVTNYMVCDGNLKTFTTSAFATPTSGASLLSSSAKVVFSAPHNGVVYFVDGTNYKKLTISTDTAATWTAASGSLPSSSSNTAKLIELWRDRIVLSGVTGDEHNWFMSCAGDATNFDYAPDPTNETQAVAGNNSTAGRVGQPVNSMVPYSDFVLIFGGTSSIYAMIGDPAEGGRIERVSDITGMTFGRPWAKDPQGNVYFFGSRGGVYRLPASNSGVGTPERITATRIEEKLNTVNLSTSIIRMAWDDREQGLYVFITPYTTGATTHYFYDVRNDAWYRDVFATNTHNPRAVAILDGDTSGSRVLVWTTADGYILYRDMAATNDDSTAIDSYVWVGPISTPADERLLLNEIQAVVATGSSAITWELYRGQDAQAAYASSAVATGSFAAGRNKPVRLRSGGNAFYLKLYNSTSSQEWALEKIQVRLSQFGVPAQKVSA